MKDIRCSIIHQFNVALAWTARKAQAHLLYLPPTRYFSLRMVRELILQIHDGMSLSHNYIDTTTVLLIISSTAVNQVIWPQRHLKRAWAGINRLGGFFCSVLHLRIQLSGTHRQ